MDDQPIGPSVRLNTTTRAAVEDVNVGSVANHFPTSSVADGLVFAPAVDQLIALGR